MKFRLKIGTYLVAVLNTVVPLIALDISIFSFCIMIIVALIWVFTAAILGIALTIIKKDWKDATNRGTNFKAMLLNFTAFCLFAVQLFVFPCASIYMINHNTELFILDRINIKAEYNILNVAIAFSVAS